MRQLLVTEELREILGYVDSCNSGYNMRQLLEGSSFDLWEFAADVSMPVQSLKVQIYVLNSSTP